MVASNRSEPRSGGSVWFAGAAPRLRTLGG